MANDSIAVWIIMWILVAYTCFVFCFMILKLFQRHFFQEPGRALHATSQTQTEESALVFQHLQFAPTESAYTSVLVGISSLLLRTPLLVSYSHLAAFVRSRCTSIFRPRWSKSQASAISASTLYPPPPTPQPISNSPFQTRQNQTRCSAAPGIGALNGALSGTPKSTIQIQPSTTASRAAAGPPQTVPASSWLRGRAGCAWTRRRTPCWSSAATAACAQVRRGGPPPARGRRFAVRQRSWPEIKDAVGRKGAKEGAAEGCRGEGGRGAGVPTSSTRQTRGAVVWRGRRRPSPPTRAVDKRAGTLAGVGKELEGDS